MKTTKNYKRIINNDNTTVDVVMKILLVASAFVILFVVGDKLLTLIENY